MWISGVAAPHVASHVVGGNDSPPSALYVPDSSANSLTQKAGPATGDVAASWILIPGAELTIAGVVPDTLRVSYEGKHSGNTQCKIQLRRSGVVVGVLHEGTGDLTITYTEYVEDVPGWSLGDVIQLYGFGSGGSHKALAQNLKVLGVLASTADEFFGVETFTLS